MANDSERTDGDATRIDRRRPSFAPWIRSSFRMGWVIIAVLLLFLIGGTDLATWILGNGS